MQEILYEFQVSQIAERWTLRLQSKGAYWQKRFWRNVKKGMGEMFSCLSEEEKISLLKLLEKVNEDWATRYQEMGKEHKRGDGHHKEHSRHEQRGAFQGLTMWKYIKMILNLLQFLLLCL